MQRTPNAADTQNTQPQLPATPAAGPQLLDPSLFQFISGGLPRDGGWSVVEPTSSATASDSAS